MSNILLSFLIVNPYKETMKSKPDFCLYFYILKIERPEQIGSIFIIIINAFSLAAVTVDQFQTNTSDQMDNYNDNKEIE